MTGCHDNEFTCNDATCVSMDVRCDGRSDCQDGTDEEECKVFVTSLGYNKHIVPSMDKGQLKLNLSICVKEITHIDEIAHFFKVKFDIKRTWFDKRLTFYNLKKSTSENKVSLVDRESVWKSWLIFDNIKTIEKALKTDQRAQMNVITNHNTSFTSSDNTYIHNTYLFDGSKNAIIDVKQYSVEYVCDFHMKWYPFDTQSCTMQLLNYDWMIQFELNELSYTGPSELPQHVVLDVLMCSKTSDKVQKVIVEFIFGRPLFISFLTITLPTVMLMTLSQMATKFSNEYLDMVIMVNLTVLLVLATL